LHPRRIVTIVIASGGLGLACLSLLGGCADESRTTGTQIQLTAKDRAEIEDMRAAMKGQRAARQQERAADRQERAANRKQRR
jgi:hypothetical protein